MNKLVGLVFFVYQILVGELIYGLEFALWVWIYFIHSDEMLEIFMLYLYLGGLLNYFLDTVLVFKLLQSVTVFMKHLLCRQIKYQEGRPTDFCDFKTEVIMLRIQMTWKVGFLERLDLFEKV